MQQHLIFVVFSSFCYNKSFRVWLSLILEVVYVLLCFCLHALSVGLKILYFYIPFNNIPKNELTILTYVSFADDILLFLLVLSLYP